MFSRVLTNLRGLASRSNTIAQKIGLVSASPNMDAHRNEMSIARDKKTGPYSPSVMLRNSYVASEQNIKTIHQALKLFRFFFGTEGLKTLGEHVSHPPKSELDPWHVRILQAIDLYDPERGLLPKTKGIIEGLVKDGMLEDVPLPGKYGYKTILAEDGRSQRTVQAIHGQVVDNKDNPEEPAHAGTTTSLGYRQRFGNIRPLTTMATKARQTPPHPRGDTISLETDPQNCFFARQQDVVDIRESLQTLHDEEAKFSSKGQQTLLAKIRAKAENPEAPLNVRHLEDMEQLKWLQEKKDGQPISEWPLTIAASGIIRGLLDKDGKFKPVENIPPPASKACHSR